MNPPDSREGWLNELHFIVSSGKGTFGSIWKHAGMGGVGVLVLASTGRLGILLNILWCIAQSHHQQELPGPRHSGAKAEKLCPRVRVEVE